MPDEGQSMERRAKNKKSGQNRSSAVKRGGECGVLSVPKGPWNKVYGIDNYPPAKGVSPRSPGLSAKKRNNDKKRAKERALCCVVLRCVVLIDDCGSVLLA